MCVIYRELASNFNSHAHVERDLHFLNFVGRFSISTHTLTWSVTFMCVIYRELANNFNSHAHVERDFLAKRHINHANISTHTLTWSVTFCTNR